MSKTSKQTKTAAPHSGGKAGVGGPTPTVEKSTVSEEMVVFAFRLTPQERDLIHKAAGPAKASRYVRTLAVAAANGDADLVLKLLGGPAPAAE